MVLISEEYNLPDPPEDNNGGEQEWDNPVNPENAEDTRDMEQLARQKEESERRKENLSDAPEDTK